MKRSAFLFFKGLGLIFAILCGIGTAILGWFDGADWMNIVTFSLAVTGLILWGWYHFSVRWINEDLPKYNIKYAESNDGIKWNQTGKIALDNHNGFTSIARPCVLKMKNIYYMWYSAKKPNTEYEIYCASSNDGIIWDYQNKINLSYGLSTSTGKDMWDSEMVEYAHVSLYEKNLIMLFNGNKYGLSGMGLAYKKIY